MKKIKLITLCMLVLSCNYMSGQDADKELHAKLMQAIKSGNIVDARAILHQLTYEEKNTLVNTQDSSGNTPLIIAIEQNNLPMVELLINNNADINLKNKDNVPPLLAATRKGYVSISEFLFERGATF